MYCQACGAFNPDDRAHCRRCRHKLLVVSGVGAAGSELVEGDVQESLDEHLLERISVLEEAVKRTSQTVRHLVEALHGQERTILVNQTGLATVRELLERRGLVDTEEWSELWQVRTERQMLALEKRQRFLSLKERIRALYSGDERRRFEELLEDAEYALFAYDLSRALEPLRQAWRLDPDNHALGYFVGETLFNEGEGEEALEAFNRVLDVQPDHFQGLVFSGVLLHEFGETRAAEERLKRAVQRYPEAFLPHFSLGVLYATQGQLARAEAYLERAVEVDPVPQALYLLGNTLYEAGRLGAAIGRLKEVVRLDPAFEDAYHLLGMAYLDRGWRRKALAAFRDAERLNPRKLRYQDLVRYLTGQGGSPLPAVRGKAAEWLDKGERLAERGELERAARCLGRALDLEPDNPTVLLPFAHLCLRLDRRRDGEEATRRILAQRPGEMLKATAYATLIEALRQEGRLKEGRTLGERLLEEAESDFARTVACYELACSLAEMEEELDRALELAHRAVELSPEELKAFPLAALGWVHLKRREYDPAVQFLVRASELEPSAETLHTLGMALLAAGQDDAAREVMSRARQAEQRSASLERAMMQCMKDSSHLAERVRRGGRRAQEPDTARRR
ncbi:MAG: tetratricopeptide repeat protein [Thermoanaerobaculia bacterium]